MAVCLVNLEGAARGQAQQLVDAERPGLDIVAERHRRAPGHGGGDDAAPVVAVEIGDRPQRRGLARTGRALDDGDPAIGAGGRADRRDLLLAQRIAGLEQPRQFTLDGLRAEGMAGPGGHGRGHVPDLLLQGEGVTGRIEPGVRHVGPALGRARRPGQAHDLGAQQHALDGGRQRLAVEQPGGGIADPLDDVGQAEHRLLPGQAGRQVFQHRRQRPQLSGGYRFRLAQERSDQGLALDEAPPPRRASAGGGSPDRCRATCRPG